jgi:F-type H+-transporting ATPase subunit gamma
MANTKKIKSQINSVANIQQITKALEIVATVKLQKVKQKAENYREFMLEFLRIVQVINSKTNIFNREERKASGKNLVIVTGTNK